MPERRSGTARLGDVDLHYELCGEGDPVVLVAGLGDDASSWAAQVEALAGDRLVLAFDNRGAGRSSVPPGPYSTREMAEDAHRLLEWLGLGPADVVGSSMGGAIAQWWAIDHPADVRRLVLTNTWAAPEPFLVWLFEHWIRLAPHGELLAEAGRLFCFSPDFVRAHPERAAAMTAGDPPDPVGYPAAAAACRDHDALGRLDEIARPTLVVAGAADVLTRPALSAQIAERIPGAELVTLEAGHMVFWERPEEFNSALLTFLR